MDLETGVGSPVAADARETAYAPPRPRPVAAQPTAGANGRRKAAPPTGSLRTGLRGDAGWFLGNDLQTAGAVWELRVQISAWINENPSRVTSWWATPELKSDQQEQSRFRARRRLLWEMIIEAAGDNEDATEKAIAVTRKLDSIQAQCGVGISRVEKWAQVARNEKKSIVEVAELYAQTNERVRLQAEARL